MCTNSSGDRNYQGHHTRTCSRTYCRPICVGSVWKRRCAHSLARWDVATPAPNWSLSLLSRLHILICICHICRKERHKARWVKKKKRKKKEGHRHKLSSLWFLHDRDDLFAWADSLLEEIHNMKTNHWIFESHIRLFGCSFNRCSYDVMQKFLHNMNIFSCHKLQSVLLGFYVSSAYHKVEDNKKKST